MFRKPRDDVNVHVGRPPSPEYSPPLNATPPMTMATKTAPLTPAPNGTVGARNIQSKHKSAGKNGNILNFFKKSESNRAGSEALFLQDDSPGGNTLHTSSNHIDGHVSADSIGTQNEAISMENAVDSRFNEASGSSKKRKLSSSRDTGTDIIEAKALNNDIVGQTACSPPPPDINNESNSIAQPGDERKPPNSTSGPFLDDSDSDDGNPFAPAAFHPRKAAERINEVSGESIEVAVGGEADQVDEEAPLQRPPSLKQEETSMPEFDDFAEFEGMEDFDDEYTEGDEFVERRWQREQRRLELEEQGFEGDLDDEDIEGLTHDNEQEDALAVGSSDASASACPVCNASFIGVSDQEASVHVNHCLDGNPTPLPRNTTQNGSTPQKSEADSHSTPPKFRRPVRPAKPGQENPFTLGKANGTSSAFSKLMSGNAEDAAWATAAAAENASRGKPSYQRTCPFYKILPGFNICVDAFRYGAVQGCNAYFLSHFHSDHYVGLTASWCHGPIYCSRPTANLVRQQLRVDPKWVVDVEFEKKIEVPGTNGVHVTMIPANHCPGSSLYLFEKIIGKGPNPKIQRVLHCGDFRACPAHVEHPLLKPDVVDSITGKTAPQKIDVCYLDTTYLNPRYAFPSQEDVIHACAEKCVSLNKIKPDATEQTTAYINDSSMANFVRQGSTSEETAAKKPDIDSSDQQNQPDDSKPLKSKVGPLLVIVGTYSIGKERICLGIARALDSKIYAPPGKQRICACLEDSELNARLTRDPRAAQVHMAPLFEIRAETLADYMGQYRDVFSRAIAFRPSGWNYRPPGSRITDNPGVNTVLFSGNWKSSFGVADLVPQRGSGPRSATYGVPYSEHSSFRELTMFCCALRIEKVIPTVNVGSAKSRERMKQWVERWNTYKKKEGLFKISSEGCTATGQEKGKGDWYAGKGTWELRTTL